MHRKLTQLVVVVGIASVTSACRKEEKQYERVTPPERQEGRRTALVAQLDGPAWDTALKHTARVDGALKALVVEVDVAPGFHAYTAGETVGKPLAVEVAADSPIAAAGPVKYPQGIAKDLPVGRSMIVEGHAQIVAPLALTEGSAGQAVMATFRYQVCTETACDRPRSLELALTAP